MSTKFIGIHYSRTGTIGVIASITKEQIAQMWADSRVGSGVFEDFVLERIKNGSTPITSSGSIAISGVAAFNGSVKALIDGGVCEQYVFDKAANELLYTKRTNGIFKNSQIYINEPLSKITIAHSQNEPFLDTIPPNKGESSEPRSIFDDTKNLQPAIATASRDSADGILKNPPNERARASQIAADGAISNPVSSDERQPNSHSSPYDGANSQVGQLRYEPDTAGVLAKYPKEHSSNASSHLKAQIADEILSNYQKAKSPEQLAAFNRAVELYAAHPHKTRINQAYLQVEKKLIEYGKIDNPYFDNIEKSAALAAKSDALHKISLDTLHAILDTQRKKYGDEPVIEPKPQAQPADTLNTSITYKRRL